MKKYSLTTGHKKPQSTSFNESLDTLAYLKQIEHGQAPDDKKTSKKDPNILHKEDLF